jgi:uncharacterized protein YdeI (YjbR/CyaY-like superfamily)
VQTLNPEVDALLERASTWHAEFDHLRSIMLNTELTEELKWGKPCYTWQGSNIVILQGFKEFCAVLFQKGVLVKDPQHLLQSPGVNSQSARRAVFTSLQEVHRREADLKRCVLSAIDVERAGLKVQFKPTSEFEFPVELKQACKRDKPLKQAFDALTPGRQRGYLLHFAAAKQSPTRAARIAKCRERILAGKGLTDR